MNQTPTQRTYIETGVPPTRPCECPCREDIPTLTMGQSPPYPALSVIVSGVTPLGPFQSSLNPEAIATLDELLTFLNTIVLSQLREDHQVEGGFLIQGESILGPRVDGYCFAYAVVPISMDPIPFPAPPAPPVDPNPAPPND